MIAALFFVTVVVGYNGRESTKQGPWAENMTNFFTYFLLVPSVLILSSVARHNIYLSGMSKATWKWYEILLCVLYDSLFTVPGVAWNLLLTLLSVGSLIAPFAPETRVGSGREFGIRAILTPLMLIYVAKLVNPGC